MAKNKKNDKPAKVARVAYPGLKIDAAGKPTVKLTAWPEDFDRKVHQPLKKSDFENEAPWLERRADFFEKLAGRLRAQAADARQFGNAKDRKAAQKLRRLTDQIKALTSGLAAQGVDVSSMLAGMTAVVKPEQK